MTAVFSERADGLLREWLSGPNWHRDRPSENARFYRFAAALMQEFGSLDIREVESGLEEAGREWTVGYEERRGDDRVHTLCQRLQVVYDFFGAVQELPATAISRPPPKTFPPTEMVGIAVTSLMRRGTAPSTPTPATESPPEAPETTEPVRTGGGSPRRPVQVSPTGEAAKAPRRRGRRRDEEAQVSQSGEKYDGPSEARWAEYWKGIVRLYPLLLERRGEPRPARLSGDNDDSIYAEMRRWAQEVLRSEEITGAEKRDVIATIIDKVYPHKREDGTVYVEVKWLK